MTENPFIRVLPDGRTLEVIPLTYYRGRLCLTINPEHVGQSYDDVW